MASASVWGLVAMPGPKTLAAVLTGWVLAPAVQFVERYVFDDWGFLVSLAVVIAVDTVLGFWLGIVRGRLNSRAFAQIFRKVLVYLLFLVAVHAAAHHTVEGKANTLLGWLDAVAYSTVLARELLSILEKTARLGLFRPPRGLVRRLEQLQDAEPMPTPTQQEETHAKD